MSCGGGGWSTADRVLRGTGRLLGLSLEPAGVPVVAGAPAAESARRSDRPGRVTYTARAMRSDISGELIRFEASRSSGEVSGLLVRPDDARWLLLFAHGAGAGMRHPFMERMARELGRRSVATLRYQFPYMEAGSRRPDYQPKLLATVRSAVAEARRLAPDLPLFAGGKSMGGRMTSLAASMEPLEGVTGLIFFGFPLHPAGKLGVERAEHLGLVDLPMLFLQGTRDRLADLELLEPVCDGLGVAARLHVVDGGDHSFGVLKRSGRSEDEVMAELADESRRFVESPLP